MSSSRTRRIAKEVADIHSDNLSNIKADPVGNGDDLTHLKGSFKGPPGTPYEGGTYTIDVKIPNDYPFRPPVMKFDTKVWHPNVSSQTVSTCSLPYPKRPKLTNALIGRHMPRYSLDRMVPCPYCEIRALVPPIPSQHARTERPTRCRGCRYADEKPERVRTSCT